MLSIEEKLVVKVSLALAILKQSRYKLKIQATSNTESGGTSLLPPTTFININDVVSPLRQSYIISALRVCDVPQRRATNVSILQLLQSSTWHNAARDEVETIFRFLKFLAQSPEFDAKIWSASVSNARIRLKGSRIS